jgi:hypothetical protein
MPHLSDHFTLRELCRSQTAARRGIDNTPAPEAVENLRTLCTYILEPIRKNFAMPFSPASGYRSVELNRRIGGSSDTSAHCRGMAADIELPHISNHDLALWVRDNLRSVFDQLILECFDPEAGPNSGWVHIGMGDQPRGQVLTYTRGKGYMNGLPGR